jgi:uncharacterized membrane protein (Fun14 family)
MSDSAKNPAKKPLSPWRKLAFVIALAVGVLGLTLQGIAYFSPPPPAEQAAPGSFSSKSSFADGRPQAIGETPASVGDWSTLFTKLGFSFVVGFSIAYAVSGFLRVALFVGGAIFLLLFGLQYAGLVTVNWGGMESGYNGFMAWLQPHIGSFKDFITSNLPASGLAAAGLYAGFKR